MFNWGDGGEARERQNGRMEWGIGRPAHWTLAMADRRSLARSAVVIRCEIDTRGREAARAAVLVHEYERHPTSF